MTDTKGIAVVMMSAGVIFVWSGAKGYSILKATQNIIQGAPASQGQTATLISSGSGSGGGGTVIPSQGGTISKTAVEGYWIAAGGPSNEAPTAAAISEAESGLQPGVVQQGQPYATTGWGLWQITPGNSEPSIGVDKALLNGLTNARAAVAKYRAAGNSFSPWTTYTSGAYRAYMG
jgi:hypothetical protein